MTILFNKEIYLDLEKRDKSPGRVSDFGMSSTILERETNWKAFATLSDFWQLLACFHLLAAWGDMFAANIGGPNFKVVFSCPPPALSDGAKILTKTDTETFFRHQIFQNRCFFTKTKFSETETQFSKTKNETFFPRPNSPKLIPKQCKNWQKSRDRD